MPHLLHYLITQRLYKLTPCEFAYMTAPRSWSLHDLRSLGGNRHFTCLRYAHENRQLQTLIMHARDGWPECAPA
jgi:hypothetical protein